MIKAKLAARKLIDTYNIRHPVKFPYLLSKLNCVIKMTDLGQSIDGIVMQGHSEKYYILCNRNRCYTRRRFTIAHEIGHIILGHISHNGNENDFNGIAFLENIDDVKKSREDYEADSFAGELLVPKDKLKGICFMQHQSDIDVLCEMFRVSKQVMEIQLKSIDSELFALLT